MRISDWSSDVCSSDLHVIGDLVDDLVALLQARGIGLRTAVLTCLRVDGGEQRIGLGTAKATREPKHLKRMLAMRIEQIEPGIGIEGMTLAAPRFENIKQPDHRAKIGRAPSREGEGEYV